jgi:adenosylhomocysteine nucleosidase
MAQAVHNFLKNNKEFRKLLAEQNILHPKLVIGDIASGDLFISSQAMKDAMLRHLPSVVCAEMEGAAVAQVCDDYEVPLTVIRVISDNANEEAHVSAIGFVNQHAGEYSFSILDQYIQIISST